MKVKYILAVCLLLVSATAMAVPAKRVKKTITLTDGTQKEVVLVGDENLHYYLDDDNIAYTCTSEGVFVKRDRHQLEYQWKKRLTQRNKHRLQRAEARGMSLSPQTLQEPSFRRRAQWGAEQNPISGDKKGLVILVNFPEKDVEPSRGQAFYDRFFNEVGFSEEGNVGSVHDYFRECSYGQFNLTFDVCGPVNVSKSINYYGKNDSAGNDMYPGELVAEACALAHESGVDFSKYDWDNDGQVDQVFVIYAGYGENCGAPAYTIWPHECSLTEEAMYGDGEGPVSYDGVTIDTYAVACELDDKTGNIPAGIGVACHEFSHCMCLPDFYDTAPQGSHYGMDAWDLMDYGSYAGNNRGNCPTPYTSYERMYCGWLTPTVLNQPCIVSDMKTLYAAPEAYIIYNDANHNEYYMLENRQGEGFSASDPAKGLLVLHVYFEPDVWVKNTPNATDVQHMTIIPADGVLSSNTNYADTWPGTTGNTELSDTSTPAATIYTENANGTKKMGKPIDNIEDVDGKISFVFNGGVTLDTPNALDATEIGADGFTARWDVVEEAANYKVRLTAEDLEPQQYALSDLTLLQEDFSKFNNGKTQDGSTDISTILDNYTATPGWDGIKLYTTPQDEVKMGTAKSEGAIYSPWLTTQSDRVTFVFTARRYKTDALPLQYRYGEDADGVVMGEVELASEPARYVVTIPVGEQSFWLGLYCEKRCYVSDISIYDGVVTEEQIDAGVVSQKKTTVSMVETDQNSYVFSNLSNQFKYTYSVCAQSGMAHSKWSNEIEVKLLTTPDGIKGIGHSSQNSGGTASNINNSFYDLLGRRISNGQQPKAKGLYIVNGKKISFK